MLKEVLENLRDGKELKLDYLENQYSEMICVKSLSFYNGRWLVGELNCMSSKDYGFGTCNCNSHSPWDEYRVDRKNALDIIKKYIENKNKDEEKREEETKFLNNLISSLE